MGADRRVRDTPLDPICLARGIRETDAGRSEWRWRVSLEYSHRSSPPRTAAGGDGAERVVRRVRRPRAAALGSGRTAGGACWRSREGRTTTLPKAVPPAARKLAVESAS